MGDVPDRWRTADLDLDGYLERVGVARAEPTLPALGELHEAHVRRFTFDNIDVLLDQHPGVDLAAVAEKFVARGRGGYCFEHATIFAAALQRLGYPVRRHLGRVPAEDGTLQARTHLSVAVRVADRWWLCDPGFGMSLIRPIRLADGVEADHYGWRSKVVAADGVGWSLHRWRDDGWQHLHTLDALPVEPVDIVAGHHYTSTFPASHFRSGLMVARYLDDRHVVLRHDAVTVRRAGQPTEFRPLAPGEVIGWLDRLEVPLTADELGRLLLRVEELNRRPS
ncbi:arylamine N-acetyltransferase [Nocardioides sp. BGMRC 2183]|nr:arylamine N-acetyltransferase [Nocardioides sp. BGMRC 2183]